MDELAKDKLYSFDEKVRVEIGPQIIELDCTEENLDNTVTHTNYQIGKIDALGKLITSAKVEEPGTKMNCVDWRGKLVPHMWKVYQLQEIKTVKDTTIDGVKTEVEGDPINRFIKVNEFEDKSEALTYAQDLFNEMGV